MSLAKENRITARVPSSVKDTIEQAASLLGTPLNQFMVQASLRAAEDVIRQEQSVLLTRRDVRALFDLLDSPAPANPALREATRRHRELTGSD